MSEAMTIVSRILDLATGGPMARAIAKAARRHWAPERAARDDPHGR